VSRHRSTAARRADHSGWQRVPVGRDADRLDQLLAADPTGLRLPLHGARPQHRRPARRPTPLHRLRPALPHLPRQQLRRRRAHHGTPNAVAARTQRRMPRCALDGGPIRQTAGSRVSSAVRTAWCWCCPRGEDARPTRTPQIGRTTRPATRLARTGGRMTGQYWPNRTSSTTVRRQCPDRTYPCRSGRRSCTAARLQPQRSTGCQNLESTAVSGTVRGAATWTASAVGVVGAGRLDMGRG
jgi:hypothetical protein